MFLLFELLTQVSECLILLDTNLRNFDKLEYIRLVSIWVNFALRLLFLINVCIALLRLSSLISKYPEFKLSIFTTIAYVVTYTAFVLAFMIYSVQKIQS